MSKVPSWVTVCSPELFAQLEISQFCANSAIPDSSPIDDLLAYFASVLPLGTPETLEKSDVLGRVLLLGLVSGAEVYFRTLIAGLIRICPVSRSVASEHVLSLGAVDYYGVDNIGLGLMEGVSFATEGEIAKYTKKLTGISWDLSSSVATAIAEFETLAHFRHAAVHARGELSPRNARALRIETTRQSLIVRFKHLQEAAQVSVNAVRAYNRHVFHVAMNRWIGSKRLTGKWETDRTEFGKLFALFRSKSDFLGGPSHAYQTYLKLQEIVKKSTAGGGAR